MQSASEEISAPSAVPASTRLKFFATILGSSWNCAGWMLSSEVVVRAASASPAGEQKLRLHVVASAQGAARAKDVRARHNIEQADVDRHVEYSSTRGYSEWRSGAHNYSSLLKVGAADYSIHSECCKGTTHPYS